MNYLDQLDAHLEKFAATREFVIKRAEGAAEQGVVIAEHRLDVEFPSPVRNFYSRINGFEVTSPALRVFRLEELEFEVGGLLPFAVFDDAHQVAFDTSVVNAAAQWDIVGAYRRNLVTLSMASFCTNKIWAWLERGRRVW